ncbi:uncharacterized protein ASPGLDRAFT_70108 [Aspergillus glaucus CBS 516.65]|uniref:Uncharacterized protein n=1 Tax=Aspergillus glaucus CBS 516.65 TaxID=1160497 RepID=A0A1L9V615_ASPGL|nr:hypothetical protein ASPGLDRAFT_70108 [Aspergillus glaucus CBS 516.65]OJJ79377.1 hypothetical protein ASPGLDRAFT_70108 [Aspergillus glaucus CBS 516.65]
MVLGQGQTINSANFLLIQAVDQVRQLEDEQCLQIYLEKMQNLFTGQSFDLYWTQQGKCPSHEEYMEIIRQKTSGLLRLLARLIIQKASALHHRNIPLESLTIKLGEYFQIRDDYKSLTETYTGQKGFCEDLDGGKFSFPLIHALTSLPKDFQLHALLQQSRDAKGLDVPQKHMEYIVRTLQGLMGEITDQIRLIGNDKKCPNWVLRLLVHRLAV